MKTDKSKKMTDKAKVKYARDYIREVKEYLEGMPVLTDDELALLDGANDAIKAIK